MRTIKFTTSYEDITSRIPGLFAYVELNEKGISSLHKATDNSMGCYNKIIENIIYDNIANIEVEDINFINGEVLKKGGTYSYKTLIRLYYQYLNSEQKPSNFKLFKNFIEYGIGKVEVTYEGLDRKQHDLVPYYIYLSTIRSLYEEMLKLQIKCHFYKKHKNNKDEIDKETEIELCCKCVLYERKGGDNMFNFLETLLEESNKRAELWLKQISDNRLCLNYSINLFTTEKDMGILTPISNKKIISQIGVDYNFNKNNSIDGDKNIELVYTVNSKLKSLRRFKTYLNKYDEEERPDYNKDWLFYYRIGQICNLSVLNDDYGNIMTVNTKIENINIGTEVNDLMAFGDIIENIELNDKNKTLTFTYWTDIHLKAICNNVTFDDDKNKKVTYDKFEIDKNYLSYDNEEQLENHHGIRYVETYSFDENSELNSLTIDEFNEYIKGENDGEIKGKNIKLFEKYEFSTYNNIKLFEKNIDYNIVNYKSIISDEVSIKLNRKDEQDNQKDIIRLDFYNGITYSPTENFDVNINRGVTSIFDKHIRFSEVKTLQDMEEFMNGSFFNIQ